MSLFGISSDLSDLSDGSDSCLCEEFAEVLVADLFLLDLSYALECSIDLVLSYALNDTAQLLLVLEHLLCIVSQVAILYVHQAVLHELHASHLFSVCLYILFLYVEVEVLNELVFS